MMTIIGPELLSMFGVAIVLLVGFLGFRRKYTKKGLALQKAKQAKATAKARKTRREVKQDAGKRTDADKRKDLTRWSQKS